MNFVLQFIRLVAASFVAIAALRLATDLIAQQNPVITAHFTLTLNATTTVSNSNANSNTKSNFNSSINTCARSGWSSLDKVPSGSAEPMTSTVELEQGQEGELPLPAYMRLFQDPRVIDLLQHVLRFWFGEE
ncbi:hypothetical protein ONZ45_g16259 [Pleurotus djamor]|nr:hypothetical protein ONZ45_g16259 [Pleurotus djamor]